MSTLVAVAFFIVTLVSWWRMFEKAGQSGWVGLVPFLNVFGVLKMAGKPFWWAVLFIIPVVQVVAYVVVSVSVARSFGKSALFGLVMAIPPLTPFFVMSLGFGEARYVGARG
jgi:uncharacterized membrane protein YhaH (DUF805 family)